MADVGNIGSVLKGTTSLKPLVGAVDDVAMLGLHYVNPDMNDAKAAKKLLNRKAAAISAGEGVTAAIVNYANHHKEEVGKEEGLFRALTPIVNTGETLLQYAVGADMLVAMGLPMLGGIIGAVGLTSAQKALNKPNQYLRPEAATKNGEWTLGHKISSGIAIGFTAIGAYGVAKTFSQNLDALRNMHADISGIPVERVSTWALLTGNVSPVVAEARSHLLKEFIPKGLAQLGGLAWVTKVAYRPKAGMMENMASFMLPQAATGAIDMFMGESILPVYSGFANAYKSGEPLTAEAYGEFILAGDQDLKKRRVGKQVATELGAEFAAEKIDPAEILREMNDGRFKARIEKLIAKDEAELAQKNAVIQPKPQAVTPAQASAKPVSMVDKIGGAKLDRLTIGKFTGRLNEENKGLPPGLSYTNP